MCVVPGCQQAKWTANDVVRTECQNVLESQYWFSVDCRDETIITLGPGIRSAAIQVARPCLIVGVSSIDLERRTYVIKWTWQLIYKHVARSSRTSHS